MKQYTLEIDLLQLEPDLIRLFTTNQVKFKVDELLSPNGHLNVILEGSKEDLINVLISNYIGFDDTYFIEHAKPIGLIIIPQDIRTELNNMDTALNQIIDWAGDHEEEIVEMDGDMLEVNPHLQKLLDNVHKIQAMISNLQEEQGWI